ncbi:hypothetical protein KNE206_18600 [Kitasatospora sp. NE20-6]|uniref:hypothetical protein n=1 Tax=Kitasatospora sp. NE20-6 TaxID=2859066 RepID=UPI0034DC0EDA
MIWSTVADLAATAPMILALLLFLLGFILLGSLALCLRGTAAKERPAIIKALAEFFRSLRGRGR